MRVVRVAIRAVDAHGDPAEGVRRVHRRPVEGRPDRRPLDREDVVALVQVEAAGVPWRAPVVRVRPRRVDRADVQRSRAAGLHRRGGHPREDRRERGHDRRDDVLNEQHVAVQLGERPP